MAGSECAEMLPIDYRYCPECSTPLSEGMVDGRLRKYCTQCHFVRYENPLPVVVALAQKDGRFLLIRRAIPPKKGYWGFPSGFVESGETPEEACLRELEEEAGVSGEIQRLLRVGRLEDTELYGDMLVVTYLVRVTSDTPVAESDEVDEVRYYSASELPSYLARSLRDVIEEVGGTS
ncbi:MAG: NUDIX hydrolase [Dehalococcoidia bacterium]|nr:NUDIX hydrolase [Dehalococcoidia bacterium]